MKNQHLIVDNLDIHYRDEGSGPSVLFLHGWGSSMRTFNALKESLQSKSWRFVTLDLPGFGESESPKEAWDVLRYAHFVDHFLEKVGINEPQVIIGHSLGGRIAIKSIAEKIITPNQLILIASAGSAESQSTRNALFMVVAKVGKFFFSILPLSFLRNSLRKKLYQAAGSTDYLNAGNMKATFLKIIRENLIENARSIKIPTLLIWGKDDTETQLSEGETLHRAIAGSILEILPHTGHFVHEENPEVVAEKIVQFIEHA